MRVVDAVVVLRLGYDGIATHTAAPEIILLKVARCFGETKVVKAVMHPVAPVEKIDDGGVAVGHRVLRQIEGKIKITERRTGGRGRIGAGTVELGLHVFAGGRVVAVVDPAIG